MGDQLSRPGHPLLAALLTVSIHSVAGAEAEPPQSPATRSAATLSEELELIRTEQLTVETPVAVAPPPAACVVTEEDIRQSGAKDLATLFGAISGAGLFEAPADFPNTNLWPSDSELVLPQKIWMVVDNRPFNQAWPELLRWKLFPVDPAEIRRIDIVDGQIWPDKVIRITTMRFAARTQAQTRSADPEYADSPRDGAVWTKGLFTANHIGLSLRGRRGMRLPCRR